MKHILFLYNRRSETVVTGGQKYEEDLFRGLMENECFTVERFCINKINGIVSKILSPIYNLKFVKKMNGYDMLFFNSVEGYHLLLLAWVMRWVKMKKIAIIHHHFMFLEFSGLKRMFYWALESLFLKSASVIITASPYIETLCKEKFIKKEIRFWPIPFSFKLNKAERTPQKGQLLYIGTIEPRKGLTYLLESLAYLKNKAHSYHLIIIGKVVDVKYKKQLDETISEFGLKVTFTGFISQEEKTEIIMQSDVFVFPSQLEGYGMVLCEAMCEGLPVICFNNSAMPFTVNNNQNGIIVPNKDIIAFAEAIEKIVDNREVNERLAAGALEYAGNLINPQQFKELTNMDVIRMLYS